MSRGKFLRKIRQGTMREMGADIEMPEILKSVVDRCLNMLM
jgi:hypothetical protein